MGIDEGRSTRTSTVPPTAAPISAASAWFTSASRAAGPCTFETP